MLLLERRRRESVERKKKKNCEWKINAEKKCKRCKFMWNITAGCEINSSSFYKDYKVLQVTQRSAQGDKKRVTRK